MQTSSSSTYGGLWSPKQSLKHEDTAKSLSTSQETRSSGTSTLGFSWRKHRGRLVSRPLSREWLPVINDEGHPVDVKHLQTFTCLRTRRGWTFIFWSGYLLHNSVFPPSPPGTSRPRKEAGERSGVETRRSRGRSSELRSTGKESCGGTDDGGK